METYDLRLISSSFTQDGEEPVIELFGRARGGKSVTVLSPGFRPYFFAVDPAPGLEETLSKTEGVVSVARDRLLYKSEDHDVLRIEFDGPRRMTEWKAKLRKTNRILAGDIPHHHRFFYDNDMGACIRVSGEPVDKDYGTDAVIRMESFENIEPFDPGLRVLSFDIENSVEHGDLLTICSVVSDGESLRACEPIVGSEKEMISAFADLIRKEDPDVISGYNIDNYDIRKIDERAKANRMKDAMPWGRDGSQPRLVGDRFWRVKGRVVCDAWWAVRRELRPKQETLNAVSMLVLGEQKLDVDPKRMDSEWAENREKVLEYCVKDAELSLRILLEVGTLRKGMDLSTVSKLTLEDVLTSGSSQLVDSLLIRMADRNKVGVPPMGVRTAASEQIEGGYVHSMNPGLYHWVCVLDFKSMYPSLIISKNICFTTLSPDGEIKSPTGARFMSKDRRVGLLPRLLSDLMDERDGIKKRMKETSDEHERRYLDGLQAAVKVLMNTFYGVFASSFYRFTDKSIGAAITSFARANVKGIIEEVEAEGVPVIYSDTDSVFMQSPRHDLDGSVEFGNAMAGRFSKDGGVLEFEKLLEPMFTHGMKKRYVGRVVWPTVSDELLVRGYEMRRSDSFDLQSDLLSGLFDKILAEKNDEALETVRRTVQNTISGNVPLESLVISRTCKGLDAYENPDRMANVQAAKKMIEMGYEFIPGMKVSWIVVDGKSSPQKVEPYVSGAPFKAKPDYRYYAERIAQTASRITEVFGWSEKDLMMGNQQSTLFSFGGGGGGEPRSRKPKPKVKSLDDFLRRLYIQRNLRRLCGTLCSANGNVPRGESVKVIQMSEETQETRPVNGRSMYSYIAEAWEVPSKSYLKELNYERRIMWRKEENFCRIERPTRLDRARALGYRAKQGYVMVRARVRKGSFRKRAIVTGRRAKRKGINQITVGKSLQRMAEERTAKRYPNLEVLNSYWVGADGQQEWYEVILVDPAHPVIKADKKINWICDSVHKNRVYRGKTSAGKKGRGMRHTGKGAEKARPSVRANNRRIK